MKKLSIKLQTAYIIVLLIQEYLAFNKHNSNLLKGLLVDHSYIETKEGFNFYIKLCEDNNDFMGKTIVNLLSDFGIIQQKQIIEKPEEILEEVQKQIRKK